MLEKIMLESFIILTILSELVTVHAFVFSAFPGIPQHDVTGLVGDTVHLPCNVDIKKCGPMHSIKWYRGTSRIFVFSEMSSIANAEGDYETRAALHYAPNSTKSTLEVKQLQVADEAVYKCEITYIEVHEGCSVVQFINLTALIKPQYVKVTHGNGSELANASLIGPFNEGDELVLQCESGDGKPIPTVYWWNGTHKLEGAYEAVSSTNSAGIGRNLVRVTLGRGDLYARYECRAENAALEAPMISWVNVSVNLRPLRMTLKGVESHVVQGSIVTLVCTVHRALPPANITWYNDTTPYNLLDVDPETNFFRELPRSKTEAPLSVLTLESDGTITTTSELQFTASLYENEKTIRCEGINPVMRARGEKPLRESKKLVVHYPPIVTISSTSGNVTVNETANISLFCNYISNPVGLISIKWYRDGEELTIDPDHYEEGTENTMLLIKNATRFDQGAYTCVLSNSVGPGTSINAVHVAVYYKPQVKLLMDPPSPVSEVDALNITLTCKVVSGNPETLRAVRWYLGGEILKELPDCDNASNTADPTFCDIDPSKLLLEYVLRGFHGNYSCEGQNEAGWGPLSAEEELIVYYPPGPATLVYEPSKVVKKGNVTLSCSVSDPGRPETTMFRWMRGPHPVLNITTANWTISPVTLETQSNFSCLAYNAGGEGYPASVYINVFAKPDFVKPLPPYYGALVTSKYVNLTCQVECSPICTVHWLKNEQILEVGDGARYNVINTPVPPDLRTNDFQSVRSTLVWNMSAWEGGQLDRTNDKANYSCQSSGNEVAPSGGVKSTTVFGVEYPPENITVSTKILNVVENNIPGRVRCDAKAVPNATYYWQRIDQPEPMMKGDILLLTAPLTRDRSGNYSCVASNKHGNVSEITTVNVQYKPECGISQSEQDGKLVLTCTASANPPEVDFVWHIKGENESLSENIVKKGHQSQLYLESYVENFRTYVCVASNEIGISIPCERDVTGHVVSWWKNLENDNYKIIVAVIVGAISMIIILCITIIVVCRRKQADKYNNPVELKERENPDGDSSLSTVQTQPQPLHKWPLRPGVFVHVNGAHTLNLLQRESAVTPSSPSVNLNHNTDTVAGSKGRAKLTPRKSKQKQVVNLISEEKDDTHQHSRANKIRQMFLNDSTKYRTETMAGVFQGKSGVVTFKKLDSPVSSGISRKRKKPGSGPSPSATKDKSKKDLNTSPSDGLLKPDEDKAFYENLPFHGMQSAPNKPECSISDAASRPSSQFSQNGSSGYGSTRSHLGSSFQRSNTIALMPKEKYCSLRVNLHRKYHPQFCSMRLVDKHKSRLENREKSSINKRKQGEVYLLSYKVPSLPPKYAMNQQKEINCSSEVNNNSKNTPEKPEAPVPAPRKQRSNQAIKHTYQNVPIPMTPNSQQLKESQNELQRQQQHQQHHHHLHYNLTSQHQLLMNPNNSQFGSSRGSHSSRAYLPPMRLEYQQPYYMTDSYGSDSIVYADLALASSRERLESHLPSHYRPQQTQTEYAILKFHDVGQEIDV